MDYRYYESFMMNLKKEMKNLNLSKRGQNVKIVLLERGYLEEYLIPRNLTLVMAYLVSNIVYGEK